MRQDRCHRIGQTKPVTVYKLVTADTVDEDIFDIGEKKRKLSTAVLSDDYHEDKNGKQAGPKKSVDMESDEVDIGAIGRILQKALLRVTAINKKL